MENSRDDHWRDVAEDGEDNSKILALSWYVYTIYKEDLIKRYFLVFIPHPKGGGVCLYFCEG